MLVGVFVTISLGNRINISPVGEKQNLWPIDVFSADLNCQSLKCLSISASSAFKASNVLHIINL